MSEVTVFRRLSEARAARGESVSAFAQRIGVREPYVRAIEEDRLADLPKGIYGRAAIRTYAQAAGLDPAETLAACEALLPELDDPISGLARMRGVRQPKVAPARADSGSHPAAPNGMPGADLLPRWQVVAAAAVDAAVVVGLLLVVVLCAVTAMTVPMSALAESGGAFGVMGVLLGAAYFVWFGGLRGATLGEQWLGVEQEHPRHPALTLAAIGACALRSATRDTRSIERLGAAIAAFIHQAAIRRGGLADCEPSAR